MQAHYDNGRRVVDLNTELSPLLDGESEVAAQEAGLLVHACRSRTRWTSRTTPSPDMDAVVKSK